MSNFASKVSSKLCEFKARPAGACFTDSPERFERLKLGSTIFYPVVQKDESTKSFG
jgi:hypothetical protein